MKLIPTLLPSSLALVLSACPSDPAPSGDESSSSDTTAASTGTEVPADSTTAADEPDSTSTAAEPSSSSGPLAESTGTTAAAEDSTTGNEGAMPDIDMTVVTTDTLNSLYTETLEFTEQSCAVADGCITAAGMRRVLRFDTITPNLGDADFHVGNPTENPRLFEMSECSGNWVFVDYARYRLLDGGGNEVGNGHKSAFALIDLAPFTMDAGPAQYGFGEDMGISVGWADIYNAGLDCQWVDITDVPPGDYTLEISINPDEVIAESTFDNNTLLLPVTLTAEDDMSGPPPEWICPAGFYDADDGCDCGCGVTDPDCADMTAASCMYCMPPGCAMSCDQIDPLDNSTCL